MQGRSREGAEELRALAKKCRRLARGASNGRVAATLEGMAADYDRQADKAAEVERILSERSGCPRIGA